MRRIPLLGIALFAAMNPAQAALLPGNAEAGKALHDRQCVACHDSRVYTRPNRSVKTIEGLMGRVRLCNQQLNANLGRDQLNDIVSYLNATFYKFP
jgi:mono/diheme cytochrome c family protein